MKMNIKIALSMIFITLLSLPTRAENKRVAKVIILKGTVESLSTAGAKTLLKKGMWLDEGAVVTTMPKSFAKLLFIDKSSINVGPESKMKIKAFPKSEAGIINLMKGQIRSKVTKDYMNMKDKDKSKLFIKTKTAAMGVRGTDFQVNYNPVNESTSLITFEGNVAMAQLTNLGNIEVTQNNLEKVVSSDQAVQVKQGQYSGASPKTPRATMPIKISPMQLKTLEANDIPGVTPAEANGQTGDSASTNAPPKKQFRNIIPPGVDAKSFSNDAKEIEGTMVDTVGVAMVQEMKVEMRREEVLIDSPPPEGMIDAATGEVAPTAGGFIDLGTAQYIPPPPGSQFDPNAGVFIPPASVGRIDPETGGFKNDHYDLTADGKFVAKAPTESINTSDSGRGPASAGNNNIPGATNPGQNFGAGNPANGDIGKDENLQFSNNGTPPPPPPEATFMPTMMDSASMAEMGELLAPPPPPAGVVLAPPVAPGTEGMSDGIVPGPDGTFVPAPGSNGGVAGGPNDPNALGPDAGGPLPPGEFPDGLPPTNHEDFEDLAGEIADGLIDDIQDDFEEFQDITNGIERTTVEFNVIVN